jgi:hypothetical protein
MALWAGGLLVSEDERFELMVARLAQVFEDGHVLVSPVLAVTKHKG